MGSTKDCNASELLERECHKKAWQIYKRPRLLASIGQASGNSSFGTLEFLSIVNGSWVLGLGISELFFWALQWFARFRTRNTVMLKNFKMSNITKLCYAQKNLNVRKLWNVWQFLSITMLPELHGWTFWDSLSNTAFRDVQDTKNCITRQKGSLFSLQTKKPI